MNNRPNDNSIFNSKVFPALLAGAASWGLNIYGAFRTNSLSKQAEEGSTLRNDLYKASRTQGIGADVLLIMTQIPPFLATIRYSVPGSLTTARFYLENWDYALGRALQGAGLALIGNGLHEDGAHNPQNATAFCAVGGLSVFAGNYLVLRHKNNHPNNVEEQKGQEPLRGNLQAQQPGDLQQPLMLPTEGSAPPVYKAVV